MDRGGAADTVILGYLSWDRFGDHERIHKENFSRWSADSNAEFPRITRFTTNPDSRRPEQWKTFESLGYSTVGRPRT